MKHVSIVFPAPAGINRQLFHTHPLCNRVPRASGDKPAMYAATIESELCSPRQRG
ncbi:hypothetical protein H1484_001594 [Salmonella enterica subsp. enterica serovar Newport]|nr:hypothetical protein [Salmonella enterica subsp. enterica serovar Newport]